MLVEIAKHPHRDFLESHTPPLLSLPRAHDGYSTGMGLVVLELDRQVK